MIIFPAIDLRRGRCVRLRQGDPAAETVFSEDPEAMARHWEKTGAEWLHVVNLDGALGEGEGTATDGGSSDITMLPVNLQRLHEIRQAVRIPIQFGGGLRTLEDVALVLELGAARVVLGTLAVSNPELVHEALLRFGAARIVVGIDARGGRVATHGWRESSGLDAGELGKAMAGAGVERVVYTDIGRDGMLSGVDVEGSASLAEQTGLKVIASGGVRDLDDIVRLQARAGSGIEGVITGQAIYTGSLDLTQALAFTTAS